LSPPELSVVIPTFNNRKYLKTTIDSLLASTNLKLEIVIIDDGSDSKELAEYFLTDRAFRFIKVFKIIRNPVNLGYIKSVNRGVMETTAPYILLLNNDVFVPSLIPDKMRAVLQNNNDVAAIGPYSNFVMEEQLLKLAYKDPAIDALPMLKEVNKLQNNQPEIIDATYLSGFCLMLKRNVMEEVMENGKLLDEIYGFGYVEDCDLGNRIKKLNYRIVIARNCFVHHYGTKTFDAKIQEELVEKNKIIFHNKWY
jgi:GT2 family glycosyltransferase